MSVRQLAHRQALLPPRGQLAADHVTAILRMPESVTTFLEPAMFSDGDHYRYPPDTVHVTVANLDQAGVSIAAGIEALRRRAPFAPARLRLDGLGCSPDTIFIRCYYGREFADLRRAVCTSFRIPRAPRWTGMVFRQLALANVLRFSGPGAAPPTHSRPRATIELEKLQIVRTDRYLSHEGTTILAEITLGSASTS